MIMYRIYFRTTNGSIVHIDLSTVDEAKQYWDKLGNAGFDMVCSRP